MNNPNPVSNRDPIPLEPDFNWISGKKRKVLPLAKLRAIPLLGVVVGIACAFAAKAIFPGIIDAKFVELPSSLALLSLGAFLGGGIGVVVYQVLAHRATEAGDDTRQ
ncbi:MAG: hypothetical protein HYR92_04460 [Burkholderiales bacterium]|nr:hypothetical protein [Burkholderiales bacterium]